MKPYRFLSSIFLLLFPVGLASASPLPKQPAQRILQPPLKEPPPKKPIMPKVIAMDGHVLPVWLTRAVTPVYPPRAKKASIRGTVILEALIGKDGRVEKLRYVSGPSLLVKATIEAVRQWRYKPILLNGKPLEVDTEISVTYTPGKLVQTTPNPKVPLCSPGRFLPQGRCQPEVVMGSVGGGGCCE